MRKEIEAKLSSLNEEGTKLLNNKQMLLQELNKIEGRVLEITGAIKALQEMAQEMAQEMVVIED